MTTDEMMKKAAGSHKGATAALESGSDAGPLVLATTLWIICAEICGRLDGILSEQRLDEDRPGGEE